MSEFKSGDRVRRTSNPTELSDDIRIGDTAVIRHTDHDEVFGVVSDRNGKYMPWSRAYFELVDSPQLQEGDRVVTRDGQEGELVRIQTERGVGRVSFGGVRPSQHWDLRLLTKVEPSVRVSHCRSCTCNDPREPEAEEETAGVPCFDSDGNCTCREWAGHAGPHICSRADHHTWLDTPDPQPEKTLREKLQQVADDNVYLSHECVYAREDVGEKLEAVFRDVFDSKREELEWTGLDDEELNRLFSILFGEDT